MKVWPWWCCSTIVMIELLISTACLLSRSNGQ
jgi:hypothetical protein